MVISYNEFVSWCKHWNYTTEEGYKAMCFTANIIGQYYGNCIDEEKKSHSDAFKKFIKKEKDDAMLLLSLYGKLDGLVFDMLEEHEKEN